MPAPYPAEITRNAWDALSPDYRTGTPTDANTRMLRLTEDLGTVLVPVEVVDRAELFPLGLIVVTPAAADTASKWNPQIIDNLINRHHRGDWGALTNADQEANDAALRLGGRLHSAYPHEQTTYSVITEGDRSATTVLLPSDY